MITQDQVDEAVLDLMGRQEWGIISALLVSEAQKALIEAGSDAQTWERVQYLRGFAEGLALVVNLRENIKKIKEQEAANAAL